MRLFDKHDLAEMTHPDYPGERLIACGNPVLAVERARTRNELLDAAEKALEAIAERVAAGRLKGAGRIGEGVGKISGKYKMDKHFQTTISEDSFTYHRNQDTIILRQPWTAST